MTPLTPLSYHILLALADEDRHGYAILKEVLAQSQGGLQPGTGALYTSIQRLVDEGHIEVATRRANSGDDPRRRYYRLTDEGRSALAAETGRLTELLSVARRKRVLTPLRPATTRARS
jgi:DNA-binding PadR family transcriptional regulator